MEIGIAARIKRLHKDKCIPLAHTGKQTKVHQQKPPKAATVETDASLPVGGWLLQQPRVFSLQPQTLRDFSAISFSMLSMAICDNVAGKSAFHYIFVVGLKYGFYYFTFLPFFYYFRSSDVMHWLKGNVSNSSVCVWHSTDKYTYTYIHTYM